MLKEVKPYFHHFFLRKWTEASSSLDSFIRQLPPETAAGIFRGVWEQFATVCTLPRPSGGEQKISRYIYEYCKKKEYRVKKVTVQQDSLGNVFVEIPASDPKLRTGILFTSHMDMVCKHTEDSLTDPSKHGVIPEVVTPDTGERYIQSKNQQTTLGADNGIMLAFLLCLPRLLKSKKHGPIGMLFTVGEETIEMRGTRGLQFPLNTYTYCINLDRSLEDQIAIGASGTQEAYMSLPVEREPSSLNATEVTFEINGLRGGHSGNDIGDETRQNAIKIAAEILTSARNKGISFKLVSMESNGPMNAIPTVTKVTIAVTQGETLTAFDEIIAATLQRLRIYEKNLSIPYTQKPEPQTNPLTEESTNRVITLINDLPHGATAETSTNLAQVYLTPDQETINLHLKSRSLQTNTLISLSKQLAERAALSGATVTQSEIIPAWEPKENTFLSKTIRYIYKNLWKKEMSEAIVSSTLEPCILLEKYPHFRGNTVAIGPRIENEHSPSERVYVPSVERIIKIVLKTIERLTESL